MSYPSVALFVDRAQRVRPDFQLTRANAVVVAELCRRLEGIPLALELAAAWVKQLPPAKMLQQLGQRFELLVSRQRDLPSRHQTLRAAIDWSYQLLSPELQRFFARLFIFRGGFTVEAAAAVCESPDQAREYLVMLRSSSLVQAEDDGRETRYRLLETLREFAADQLRTEERDETGRRHAEYYKKLAETAEPHVNGGPLQTQWLDRLEVEHENLRAALTWLQERRHAETGLEFAAALQMFWTARGHLSEGRERLTELLELPESAGKAARARALTRAAAMANRQGDHAAAQVLCERSLEISRKLGHRPLIQQGLFYLGNAFIRQDDPAAAQAAYAESLAIARELDDRLAVARTLRNLGLVARRQGDRPAERALTEESLPLCRELGAHWDMAEAMINLGQNARSQGDDAAAHSFLQESLAIGRELGSQLLVGDVLYFLGLQEQERGDPERAWGYYQESLTHKREIGDR